MLGMPSDHNPEEADWLIFRNNSNQRLPVVCLGKKSSLNFKIIGGQVNKESFLPGFGLAGRSWVEVLPESLVKAGVQKEMLFIPVQVGKIFPHSTLST